MMEYLDDNFHPLEDPATRTRVGIGVATGNDNVYVTKDPNAAEPEAHAAPLDGFRYELGQLQWSQHYLVNPWDEGRLVDLEDWPKLAVYYESHGEQIRKRRVAAKAGNFWYRTIDKVSPHLADRPKLLFPDMRMTSRPVYDPGGLYPHHNLYFVISEGWDLEVLGGLLFSKIVEATIAAYCVKMRGGTLRFQAQYLRQVRVPRPDQVTKAQARSLAKAFAKRDPDAATAVACDIYDLDPKAVAEL